MADVKMTLFVACYDNRPKDWYNTLDDCFFPKSPDNELYFVVKGYAMKASEVKFTFKVFDGEYESSMLHSAQPLLTYEDLSVAVNSRGFFFQQLNSDGQLTYPSEFGATKTYTAAVYNEGVLLDTSQFMVSSVPADATRLLDPIHLKQELNSIKGGMEAELKLTFTFKSKVAESFGLLIGAYYPHLEEGRELFDSPNYIMPPYSYQPVWFEEKETRELTFTLTYNIKGDGELEGEAYVVLVVAGRTFMKIPAKYILWDNDADMLRRYLTPLPATLGQGEADTDLTLMPKDFRQMLTFLDKRQAFNSSRDMYDMEWNRRHLVLTGKHGTGKRTAARELGNKLIEAGSASDIYEVDAIELLDPTNGYSPNIESALDQHASSVMIVNDAEALTLKGSVGALSGMEILANKLKKMTGITVVLLGKKGQLEELINLCEPARDLFYTFYNFTDVEPKLMARLTEHALLKKNYRMSDEAFAQLSLYLERAYSLRGNNFANMYFAKRLVDDEILPRLIKRTVSDDMTVSADVNLITADDIPQVELRDPKKPMQKLEQLVGLDNVKKSIINHTALVRLNKIRADRGLYNRMPPMHMVFTGNPGTGKTTIAEYLGEIYRGIGALSSGHLVQTDRSKLVGQYIGDTEKNTLNAIRRASGGVLFIDEAYNLFIKSDDNRDFGMRVIETLLTYLSMEETDMIVILAGYTNEMKRMLESNPGLKSRFPYIFHFDDYSPEQLLNIGKLVLRKEQYELTPEAELALSKYIIEEYNQKDEHFGNGRFITRLLKSHIIPSLSQRLTALPIDEVTDEMLSTIEVIDIPRHEAGGVALLPLDETILKDTLDRLSTLIGLATAKKALSDYVTTMRLEREERTPALGSRNMYWNFIGNTGTGKSTVAELLAKLLQGLGLLKRGHCVTLNIEELSTGDMYKTIEKSLKKAEDGLLFMDMDSPRYRNQNTDSIRLWITNKIKETRQQTAVVFAEAGDGNEDIAKSLASNGIASLFHTVVFSDFTSDELQQLLLHMLSHDFCLDTTDEARTALARYVDGIRRSATRNQPVNARTMQMLAQTIAQHARLRIAADGDAQEMCVTLADVEKFDWKQQSGRIGF